MAPRGPGPNRAEFWMGTALVMLPAMTRSSIIFLSAILMAACTSTGPSGPVPGFDDVANRVSTTCPDRVRPLGSPGGSGSDICNEDADCGEDPSGRCNGLFGQVCCTYDQCITDDDCGADSACLCGAGPADQNLCVPAFCRTNADCEEGGRCAFSEGFGYPVFFQGYACIEPDAECAPGTPCVTEAGVDGLCEFDRNRSERWRCLDPGSNDTFRRYCSGPFG